MAATPSPGGRPLGRPELKNDIEKFVDIAYLHCRAFEEYDAEDWLALNACYAKLNKIVRVQRRQSIAEDPVWRRNSTIGDPDWSQESMVFAGHNPQQNSSGPCEHLSVLESFVTESISTLTECDGYYDEQMDRTKANAEGKKRHRTMLGEVWRKCTGALLEDMIEHTGPQKAEKLLSSLCVRIRCKSAAGRFKWHRSAWSPVKIVAGTFEDGPDEVDGCGKDNYLSDVTVFYSEVDLFFEGNAATEDDMCVNLLNVSQSLCNCGGERHHQFATPIGQAISTKLWAMATWYFIVGRVLDFLFQVALSWQLAPTSRSFRHTAPCPEWPAHWQLVGIALLGVRGFVTTISDLVFICGAYGKHMFNNYFFRSLRMSPILSLNILVDAFSCWFACWMLNDYWSKPDGVENMKCTTDAGGIPSHWRHTYLHDHPTQLSSLIFAKWFQSLMMLMGSDLVLPYLLPVWAAISSSRSRVFLLYLLLLSIGTALAYLALPTGLESDFGGFIEAMYRLGALNLLGELDADQLEGIGEDSNETLNKGSQPGTPTTFHEALRLATIGIGFLFPVILLNMYVGILSAEHELYMKRVIHASGVYRSRATFQLLVGRLYCTRVMRMCCGKRQGQQHSRVETGTFILIPSDLVAEYERSETFMSRPHGAESLLESLRAKKLFQLLEALDRQTSGDADTSFANVGAAGTSSEAV